MTFQCQQAGSVKKWLSIVVEKCTHTYTVSWGEMVEIRELQECGEEKSSANNGMVTGTQLERKRRRWKEKEKCGSSHKLLDFYSHDVLVWFFFFPFYPQENLSAVHIIHSLPNYFTFSIYFSSSHSFLYSLPECTDQLWERLTRGHSDEQNKVQRLAVHPFLPSSLFHPPPLLLLISHWLFIAPSYLPLPPPFGGVSINIWRSRAAQWQRELIHSPRSPSLPLLSLSLSISFSLSLFLSLPASL